MGDMLPISHPHTNPPGKTTILEYSDMTFPMDSKTPPLPLSDPTYPDHGATVYASTEQHT